MRVSSSTRTGVLSAVLDALRRSATPLAPVRVLLLTRTGAAGLRDPLHEVVGHAPAALRSVLDHASENNAARTLTVGQRHALYTSARTEFTSVWSSDDVDTHHRPGVPDLSGEGYELPLEVLSEALDHALGGQSTDAAGRSPVQRVLDHEQRYWHATAPADLPAATRRAAVALATLAGAADPDEANTLLATLPDLAGEPAAALRRRAADWLAGLYPGPDLVNPLRPDRLGEAFIADVLAAYDDRGQALLTAVVDLPADGQVVRCLDLAARLSAVDATAARTTAAVLAARHDALVTRAEVRAHGGPGRLDLAAGLLRLLTGDVGALVASAEPGSTTYQHGLSISYKRLADLADQAGQGEQAEALRSQALAIRRGPAYPMHENDIPPAGQGNHQIPDVPANQPSDPRGEGRNPQPGTGDARPPEAPVPPPGQQPSRSAAMWAHLGPLVPFVAALPATAISPLLVVLGLLLLWLPVVLIRRSRSNRGNALVRYHTAQSLNLIFTFYLVLIPAIGVVVLAATSGIYNDGAGHMRGIAIGATIAVAAYTLAHGIGASAFAIVGATRAWAGVYVRFPIWIAFRIIPDRSPPETAPAGPSPGSDTHADPAAEDLAAVPGGRPVLISPVVPAAAREEILARARSFEFDKRFRAQDGTGGPSTGRLWSRKLAWQIPGAVVPGAVVAVLAAAMDRSAGVVAGVGLLLVSVALVVCLQGRGWLSERRTATLLRRWSDGVITAAFQDQAAAAFPGVRRRLDRLQALVDHLHADHGSLLSGGWLPLDGAALDLLHYTLAHDLLATVKGRAILAEAAASPALVEQAAAVRASVDKVDASFDRRVAELAELCSAADEIATRLHESDLANRLSDHVASAMVAPESLRALGGDLDLPALTSAARATAELLAAAVHAARTPEPGLLNDVTHPEI